MIIGFLNSIIFFYFFIAIIPGLVLMAYIIKEDRTEREPLYLIKRVLGYGALSTIIAIVLEVLFSYLYKSDGTIINQLLSNFVGVALIEEGCKYAVVKRYAYYDKAFDYRFDGIVYAAAASLGFAILENIIYVFNGGVSVALTRAFTSLPGHLTFGIWMGFFLGYAKKYAYLNKNLVEKIFLILSLLIPTCLHGTYDFILTANLPYSTTSFFGFIIFLDIISIMIVKHTSHTDEYLYDKRDEQTVEF